MAISSEVELVTPAGISQPELDGGFAGQSKSQGRLALRRFAHSPCR